MSKTILYVVLLVLLGFGVYYFIFSERDTFSTSEAGFTVKDTVSLSKIYIADKAGNAIKLERRKDGSWALNDKYSAIPRMVNSFLNTLQNQQALYPVPEESHNMVVKSLSASGIKVELYRKDGDKIRTFYVGGQVGSSAGTYMLMEGAERPFVVQIEGFSGYLTPRYVTQEKEWRDRTIFNTASDDIKEVKMQYMEAPLNSFTLERDAAGEFNIGAHPELVAGKTLNKRRAKVFSGYFEKMAAEGFLNGTPGIDSVLARVPKYGSVELVDKKGRKQHMDIYWMPVNQRSKNLDISNPDIPDEFDADRLYATINNNKDTVIIQRYVFDKVFRRAFEFYEADVEQKTGVKDTVFTNTIRVNRQ